MRPSNLEPSESSLAAERASRLAGGLLPDLQGGTEVFRALGECAPVGIFLADTAGHAVYLNPRLQEICGFPSEEAALGLRWLDFVHPEDREGLSEAWAALVRSGGEFVREIRWPGPSGLRWTIARAAVLRGDDGAAVGFVGTVEDVTKQHALAYALAESETTHRVIVETALDYAMFRIDPQGRIVSWSPGSQRLFGHTEEEVLGREFTLLFTPEALARGQHVEELRRAAEKGHSSDEDWHMRKDGSRFWASGTTAAVRDPEGRIAGYVKVARDLTERKRIEDDLRRAHAQAQELQRQRAELLGAVAHDLRSPLAAIQLQLDLLRQDRPDPQRVQHALALLERNTARLTRLSGDLMDLVRLEHRQLSLRLQRIDLRDLVLEALDQWQDAARHAGVELRSLASEPVHIQGDSTRLGQVLDNLVSNALKFTPPGGTVTVQLEPDWTRGRAVLSVQDTGVGMTREQLQQLFQPFRQLHAQGTQRVGTGLGLYISRGIVEQHHGILRADSAGPGQGTTMRVELPLLAPGGVFDPVENP